jgi:PadR family transcriptional regulator, regulatory protein PadR
MRHRLSERTGHLIEETWNNPPGAPVILFSPIYNGLKNMTTAVSDQEWKKGSAELLVLSLLEDQPRHGYDISKLIELRSGGALSFHVTSLYPLLHRLEEDGSIKGRWVEKAEQRRRRYYSLTPQGRKVLRSKQKSWQDFVATISRITGIEHA